MEIEAIFIHETTNAVCLRNTEDGGECWFPKSQIDWEEGSVKEGDTIDIEIPTWLLEEKGW